MRTISDLIKSATVNQSISLKQGGAPEYILGVMKGFPQARSDESDPWHDVEGALPTVFVWTPDHVFAILPEANEQEIVEMMFSIWDDVDPASSTAIAGGAKEFSQKLNPVQPRFIVSRQISGSQFFAADLAVLKCEVGENSSGMMTEGEVGLRYVLYETQDSNDHILFMAGQKGLPMTGSITPTTLHQGQIVSFDDVIESIN